MCGIAGFIGEGSQPLVEKMTRTLSHRGPDGEGYFLAPLAGAGSFLRYAALGHRRLSIIDVAGGAQPMYNEDKSIVVVFNGEIYNYKKIRATLAGRHTFATSSDTEVIVHLYEEKGEDCIVELEGMFALAIWDMKQEKLLLARDRFGEKPLYYFQTPNVFLFGSELKALMVHPEFRRELDTDALRTYMLFECLPAPHTIFRHAYKLEAGHTLTLRQGKIAVKAYWDLADAAAPHRAAFTTTSERDLLAMLDQKLDASVSKMLMSDVPLGVFLSGGLDSSTVAYYAQKNSSKKIETFSIGFSEASFDESPYAAHVAKRLGTVHHTRVFNSQDLLDVIPKIYGLLDDPLADPSLIPTYLLASFARGSVTVALGGDGSDEFFMGYATFQAEKLAHWYMRLPEVVREQIIRPLINKMPASLSYMSLDFRLKRFVNNLGDDAEFRNQRWIAAFAPEELYQLFPNFKLEKNLYEDIAKHLPHVSSLDIYHRLSYLYTRHYLQDYVLAKVDRASMYNSLEVRAPFLDPDLAAFAFALPYQEKVRGLTTKHILKKLMRPRLGRRIVDRKKQGFQPPIAHWLQRELADLVDAHLHKRVLQAQGIFNPGYVARVVDEHRAGTHDHRKKLWTLLVFQMWYKRFGI